MVSDINNSQFEQYAMIDYGKKLIQEENNEEEDIKECPDNLILARDGDIGFVVDMDLNQDGKITYKEFKKYCEDHSISNEQRQTLLETMKKTQIISAALNPKKKNDDDKVEEDDEEDEEINDSKENEEEIKSNPQEETNTIDIEI